MMSRSAMRAVLVCAALAALFTAFYAPMWGASRVVGERLSLLAMPSAEKAYTYGSRHFDARNPGDYDINRAASFFAEAERLDPTLPLVQHQLARISFLKGDFADALSRIDLELKNNQNPSPSSYYVRGLIEGFMGDYKNAARDYEAYLKTDPNNWAAINDYAWVLLKNKRYKDALVSLDWGLIYWPENPWLHNSRATALFELGRLGEASAAATAASRAVEHLTEKDWLQAYPGNDPLIAQQGIESFKKAVEENMHSIEIALEKAQKDMQ